MPKGALGGDHLGFTHVGGCPPGDARDSPDVSTDTGDSAASREDPSSFVTDLTPTPVPRTRAAAQLYALCL
ncbi:hypothetical protein NDU88_010669 [Pleurodeles waltl]|uniref:Uncharacterized protein n=1 Tax=Pleurodeles waltl TaxID=8319 RepID=A0AAV7PZF0_PLEWA|nr:hypothetical protein NDU88_010669 [Pleurodeles waltl]